MSENHNLSEVHVECHGGGGRRGDKAMSRQGEREFGG